MAKTGSSQDVNTGGGKKIFPLIRKINLIVGWSLFLGIGILILVNAITLIDKITVNTNRSIGQQAKIIATSVDRIMLNGDGPSAVEYFDDINRQEELYEVKLFRTNQVPAFSDSSTVESVNRQLDEPMFTSLAMSDLGTYVSTIQGSPLDNQEFDIALNPMREFEGDVLFTHESDGQTFQVIYSILTNKISCSRCHGTDSTIRGVIEIQADITDSIVNERISTIYTSVIFFIAMLLGLSFLIILFIRRTVIKPVSVIGDVCAKVTEGDFSTNVDIKNNDEIGLLGSKVNSMVQGLYERFALSKYVSSSTMANLSTGEKGQNKDLVLLFSDIRGFTQFSDNHRAEEVVLYLNKVLQLQSEIIARHDGDIDKYVGDEVIAIFDGPDSSERAVSTALEIQQVFAERSDLDLSGLKVGIGINKGEVILGKIGSDQRADFTIIGDTVNAASRLCDAAKAGQTLVSRELFEPLKGKYEAKGPYKIKVKGKKDYLIVYVLGEEQ